MIIWYALQRIIAKHFLYHMAIPLFIGALAEIVVVYVSAETPDAAYGKLREAEHFVPVLAVLIAYFVVMLLIVTKEASAPHEPGNFGLVEDVLKDATEFFAISSITMREWFEPGAFQYFALLLSEKQERGDAFRYHRVMLFPNDRQQRRADLTLIDGYHARAFAKAHVLLQIPLGWLRPVEFQEVVNQLPPEMRRAIRKVPRVLRYMPAFVLSRFSWPVQLDFAIVQNEAGTTVIIVPFKKERLRHLENEDEVRPYVTLAKMIKKKIYREDGVTLTPAHDYPPYIESA